MKKMGSMLLAMCLLLSVFCAVGLAERQTIEFWYHSADEATDTYYQSVMDELNAAQDQYQYNYTSFAFSDFQEKFQMAVMTNTLPDVVSLGFSNISTFTAQNSILALNDYLDQIPNYEKIDSGLMENLIALGNGTIYGVPFAYNQEVAWYNAKLLAENGIDAPPATQKEYLALCEQYANKEAGTYFTTLRGVRPYDSLLAWLFTYTDGCGYNGSWFDDEGKCILADERFVEALDAYANIYKNGWCSGDSVNNNYDQIVAEFGSGVAMYLVHNSSSEVTHRNNLGEGNFGATTVLANDEGRYYASGLQPNVFCVANKGEGNDYAGALALVNELLSAKYDGGLCEAVGRVPCNVEVQEQDWYKNSETMMLYAGYLADENYVQIINPYWLTDFSTMITTDMTADFQAVLMGEMSSADCLAKWAEQVDGYQAEYLASLGE